MLIMLMLN